MGLGYYIVILKDIGFLLLRLRTINIELIDVKQIKFQLTNLEFLLTYLMERRQEWTLNVIKRMFVGDGANILKIRKCFLLHQSIKHNKCKKIYQSERTKMLAHNIKRDHINRIKNGNSNKKPEGCRLSSRKKKKTSLSLDITEHLWVPLLTICEFINYLKQPSNCKSQVKL